MPPETWLRLVYGAGYNSPDPENAVRILDESPDLTHNDLWLACATGEEQAIRKLAEHPNQPGGPMNMPPLFAVAYSSLLRLPLFSPALRRAATLLLDAGADVNGNWFAPEFPASPLSPLYAAAGANHDAELTRLLLARGANPNDGESLYHSLEAPDLTCTRLLLEAGANPTGANALCKVLDYVNLEALHLLLAHGADPNERNPLRHAIRRRRSTRHIETLLKAGANPQGAYRQAMLSGLPEIAAQLPPEHLSEIDQFVAACARGEKPGNNLIPALDQEQLKTLPNLAEAGCNNAVRLMVESGWPIDVRGGDIDGSALNHAVFRGDPDLTRFLLAHGADWRTPHAYNDNVMGTLSFVSRNRRPGDWVACAKALFEGGMPLPGPNYQFSSEVEHYFATKLPQSAA